ncbi:hypothetical protein BKM31_07830 [[Actinomadura] parvosata subsp. kistnae]|uniref:Uncharacterized protein n=1 Tax=[Actinomadura] parvosata subsp. kistnae TaxID=1909395 RepID=A0A1U9ZTW1_9ACTN|nr:hypothetical protein [Nonomuraea sp. ATCC 55076]AQZ61397.1 hypothetical protein BKM31_07830 [Nonomuraea sp. ATCC 55076]
MNPLVRGVIVTAAAILPGKARRERYLEQWLADGDGAAEAGIRPLSVALGALRAALMMNLTRHSVVPLGLAVVLVVGGVRMATATPDRVIGTALAMAGVALPFLLLVIRRFTERDTLGDWEDALSARQAGLSRGGDGGGRVSGPVLGAVMAVLAALLLVLLLVR